MAATAYESCTGELGALLADLKAETERLILVGPYPELTEWRRWFLAAAADGWGVVFKQLRSDGRCVVYCCRGARRIRVSSMAEWIGDDAGSIGAGEARNLMRHLGSELARAFRLGDARVPMVTPSRTGLWLWAQSASHGAWGPRPLPEDQQQLIRSTESQQREELLTLPGLETLPAFYYADLRLAYPSCCEGLPVGPARHLGALPELLPTDRGRVRVLVTIPGDWAHVGLLPFHEPGSSGWCFPWAPGYQFTTWADCCEVRHAQKHGWRCDVLEALLFTEGRPLDTWRDRLMTLHQKAEGPAAAAYRAICLHAIGAFQGRGLTETLTGAPIAGGRIIPTVERRTERASELDDFSHPEWCAAIWARTRLKLAKAALSLPREAILGMRLDALYSSVPLTMELKAPMGQWRLKGAVTASQVHFLAFCGAGGECKPFLAPHEKPALNRIAALSEEVLRRGDFNAVG